MTLRVRIAVLCVLICAIALPAVAQDPPILSPQSKLTREQRERKLEIIREVRQAYFAQFRTRTAADYNLVYIVGPALLEDTASYVAVNILQDNIPNLVVVASGSDFERLAENDWTRFDSIVIHRSALEWLDAESIQRAYARGIAVTTLGMRFEEHAALTGDRCSLPATRGDPLLNDPRNPPKPGDLGVIVSWHRLRANSLLAAQLASLNRDVLSSCKDEQIELDGVRVGVSSASWLHEVRSAGDLEALVVLVTNGAVTLEAFQGRAELESEINLRLAQEGLLE
ncbi:MAG: hypothetical protein IPM16_11840 [Chloroflexi bacterium]|nr:hypothetical protein [Chloroflexota bacterium]